MNPLSIRRAEAIDAPAISALIQSVSHHFTIQPDGSGADAFMQGITSEAVARYIADPALRYFAGWWGAGQGQGQGQSQRIPAAAWNAPPRSGHDAHEQLAGVVAVRHTTHLFHLFVAPRFQRRGIAWQLWELAEGVAVAAGNTKGFTVSATRVAVPVYQRFGFVATGPVVEKNGIAYVPMQLRLTRT